MDRISKFRSSVLLVLVALVLAFYALRLYKLQVVETEGVKNSVTTYTTWTTVKAARGDILDRNGNVMVGNRASYDLIINHYVMQCSDHPNESLRQLLQLCRDEGFAYIDHFPVSNERPFTYTLDQYGSTWKYYFQAFLENRGPWDSDISASLLVETLRDYYEIPADWTDEEARMVIGLRYELSLRAGITTLPNYCLIEDAKDDELSAILELNIPGLVVEASTVREYHTDYAAHILGFTGAMDPAQWEIYKDQGYSMDAEVGQSGFELAFEEYLHGIDGLREDEVLSDGTVVSSRYLKEPQSGNHVQVTIDLGLQEVAEIALAENMAALKDPNINKEGDGLDCEGAAVVALDTATGGVLICASYPTYSLERYFEDYDATLKAEFNPLYNRALQATYPPGSVYKVSVAVAALEAGAISATTKVTDEGVFTKYDGFTPACMVYNLYKRTHGAIDVTEALMVSCNYFFYEMGDRLSIEKIDSTAKDFGLGEPTGIELAEDVGHRSNPEVKASLYSGDTGEWYTGDKILTAIGQSENSFSPMQLAVYCNTIANQGTRLKATFLSRVVSSDYRSLLVENEPQTAAVHPISDDIYATIIDGMTKVVYEYEGTVGGTVLERYPIPICAKTGTSDHTGAGSANGALICFGPTDDPQIAMALYGEKIAHGPNMAPVAKKVFDAFFSDDSVGVVGVYENRVS